MRTFTKAMIVPVWFALLILTLLMAQLARYQYRWHSLAEWAKNNGPKMAFNSPAVSLGGSSGGSSTPTLVATLVLGLAWLFLSVFIVVWWKRSRSAGESVHKEQTPV
jgi:hypothetical protein